MSDKVLVVEEPRKPAQDYPWNDRTIRKFNLTQWEQAILEKGQVLWRDDTAFTLENEYGDPIGNMEGEADEF